MWLFNILSQKTKQVVGIDIGSASVKIVQLEKVRGRVVLNTYGSLAIGPYVGKQIGQHTLTDVDTLVTLLNVLFKEAQVTAVRCTIAIPFDASFLSLIEVPDLPEEKIAQVIEYQARKYIPVDINQVEIDSFIIPKTLLEKKKTPIFEIEETKKEPKKETRKVLLIALLKNILHKYKEVAVKKKLNVEFFEIEIFSTLRSCLWLNRYPVLIIDIGARSTKFYILESNIVLTSYYIQQGGQTLTDSIVSTQLISFKDAELQKREFGLDIKHQQTVDNMKLVLDDMFTEASSVIKSFEAKYRKNIGKIYLSGGGAILKGLRVEALKHFSVEVEATNPFSKVKVPDTLSEILKTVGPQFSVALGAALRTFDNN